MGNIVVVGGGAAGCMAALTAAERGASVTLLERNEKLGRKLYLTGKGRCNLTNSCDVPTCLAHLPRGAKFLTSAFTRFSPADTMALFERLGTPLKVERGNRVFPVSDRAADVIDALLRGLRRTGVTIIQERATALDIRGDSIAGVKCESGRRYSCQALVLATGGMSYPTTGSTGDGYALSKQAGHTITPLRGSLVPLEAEGCAGLQGLSLRNVALRVKQGKKCIFEEQGELLFTHFGLSGPLVLSASAHLEGKPPKGEPGYTAWIDLKPALDEETLDRRLVRELTAGANRDLRHVLETLEPRSLVSTVLARAGLEGQDKAHSVTKRQRRTLLETLKGLPFPILGVRPVEEAIITAGGVRLRELSPKTLESKYVRGLYFAGELLDADAYTGGFNLQIAWSTGRIAGECAAAGIV